MTTRPAGADDLSGEQFDRLVDTIFAPDEPGAHFSAIHGVFHSKHPRGPALVRRFLRRPDVDPNVREYAESALARGRVL